MMPSTVTEFLSDLRQSKIGKALLDERAAKARASRQAVVDELADWTKKRAPECARADERAIAPLVAEEQATRLKHDAAQQRLRAAEGKRQMELHDIDHHIGQLTRELAQTADPRIDEARHAMERRLVADRDRISTGGEILTGRFDGNTMRPEIVRVGNSQAVRRLHSTMRATRAAFDALKLQNPADVEAAIAAVLAPVESAWARIGELDPYDGPKAA